MERPGCGRIFKVPISLVGNLSISIIWVILRRFAIYLVRTKNFIFMDLLAVKVTGKLRQQWNFCGKKQKKTNLHSAIDVISCNFNGQ